MCMQERFIDLGEINYEGCLIFTAQGMNIT